MTNANEIELKLSKCQNRTQVEKIATETYFADRRLWQDMQPVFDSYRQKVPQVAQRYAAEYNFGYGWD